VAEERRKTERLSYVWWIKSRQVKVMPHQTALRLNPESRNAAEMLKKLQDSQ